MSLETLSSRAPSLPMPTTHSSARVPSGVVRRAVHRASSSRWACTQAMSSANSASSVTARGDQAQGRLLVAVERDQPLHDQLAQDAQGGAGVVAALAQQCRRRPPSLRGWACLAPAMPVRRRSGGAAAGRIASGKTAARFSSTRSSSDASAPLSDNEAPPCAEPERTVGGHNSWHILVFMNATPAVPVTFAEVLRSLCANVVAVAASDRLAGAGAGLGSAAWLDCAPNRRASPRPGNRSRARPGGTRAHRQHRGAQRGPDAVFRAQRRGAAGPARARRRCVCRACWRRLSPRSLWNLGFEQLYIDSPELDIRRAADGKLFVGGLDFSRSSDTEGRAADWFFSQTEFVIRNGTVRWTDEMRGAPPLALEQVDFVMRNGARRHALRLDATPPPQWGERFSLRGLFRQPLLSAPPWPLAGMGGPAARRFLQGRRVAAAALRQLRASKSTRGTARLRAWADVVRGPADRRRSRHRAGRREHHARAAAACRWPCNRSRAAWAASAWPAASNSKPRACSSRPRDGQRWPGGNLFAALDAGRGQQAGAGRAARRQARPVRR